MATMQRHYRLPRTWMDRAALATFTFGGLFLLWYEGCHIMWCYHDNLTQVLVFHYCMAFFIAGQIYSNMWMLATTQVSLPEGGEGDWGRQQGGEGWRYCDKCQCYQPPRSHHCKLCDICILHRDHHCWFAGFCVGHHNHRYFVIMTVYMVIAAFYCNVYNTPYLLQLWGGFSLTLILAVLAPHMGFVFGYYDLYTFAIIALAFLGFLLNILFVWLLEMQIMQIYRGQTRYERKKNIRTYDLGVMDNVKEVLGERWYLTWLCPFISSPLPGDGISFRTKASKAE